LGDGSAGIFGGAVSRLRSLWGGGGVGSRPRPEAFPGSAAAALGMLPSNNSGEWVTPANALTIPAVYSAVNAIASDLASLPLELRRPGPAGGSEVVRDHPAARLFSRSPDGSTTPQQFLRSLVANALVHGNGYARSTWSGGYPVALRILDPARVRPVEAAGSLDFDVAGEAVPGSQVIQLAALSLDGLEGESPVELCRQTLGLSRAAESYAAAYFGAGASTPGFFTMPGTPSGEKLEATRRQIKEMFSGGNRHAPGVFLPGTDYKEIGGSPAESQLLQLRSFQVLEVARIFRVPPHKLGDFSRASYASVEAANIAYYLETLRPWAEALEAVLGLRLLTETELSAGWSWRFDFGALLRADTASRASWIRNLAASGLLRVDEGRALADLPPLGGEAGAALLVPLNTGPLDKVINPAEAAK
jgi:HK97 family phage portal protein